MEEEKKISLKDIIKLLLGNKWIYLIMVAAFFVTSIVGFSLYSYLSKEYIAFFNYDVAGFTYDENNGCFIDGEKFDPRSLLTEDKVNSYLKSNDSLNDFTYNEVITKGGVKSFEYKIKYEKNDHVMNDEDNKYIESERGFELILNAKTFSKEQAKYFVEIVANQVIEISKEKIDSIKYDFYLKSFRGANSYSDKVSSLESGIEFPFLPPWKRSSPVIKSK